MSVKLMGRVFELAFPPPEKLLVLALADRGSEIDGSGAYESVNTLAKKCSVSRRTVLRLLKRLKAAHVIRAIGMSHLGTIEYQITLERADLEKLRKKRVGGDNLSLPPVTPEARTGANLSPPPVTPEARRGDTRVTQSKDLSKGSSKIASGCRSLTQSQDARKAPVETVENPSGLALVFSKAAKEKTMPKHSADPLREEFFRGIYRKKVENAIFDARRLAFPLLFREAATEAALSLCSNRPGKMIGIDHEEIAAIVVKRCAANFATLEALSNFDRRVAAIATAIVNATVDAAVELRRSRPHPQGSLFGGRG